jgi:hypothetical protein
LFGRDILRCQPNKDAELDKLLGSCNFYPLRPERSELFGDFMLGQKESLDIDTT